MIASATSPQLRQREHATQSVLQTEAEMIKAIREAGRTPVQRNTFYEPIKVLVDGYQNAMKTQNDNTPALNA